MHILCFFGNSILVISLILLSLHTKSICYGKDSQSVYRFREDTASTLREQLAFITKPQKELLYAIHAEGEVQSITSAAFNRKHRLRSPSSTQSAALKLLEYDMITRREKIYSISDPLMNLWLGRK